MTKWFYGFNSQLVQGPVIPKTLSLKLVVGPCLHGTQDEVGTIKHNWSAWCQYNATGWVRMLAHAIPMRQHYYKEGIESHYK